MMEVDGRTSHCNENRHFQSSTPLNEHNKPAENTPGTSEFVNHAAIAWEESRRKWIGDMSPRSHIIQNDPIIRKLNHLQLPNLKLKEANKHFTRAQGWSTTYEDLLSTNDPFAKPIPLPEMVDFLVDIWHDEGLLD